MNTLFENLFKRKGIVAIIVVAVMVVLLALVIIASTANNQVPRGQTSTSPTPAANQFSAERAEIEPLAKSLAAAYFTYQNPSSDQYFGSIRPYLTDELFADAVRSNAKAAGLPIPALSSAVDSASFAAVNADTATTIITLTTSEAGIAQPYQQTVSIDWSKGSAGWKATNIALVASDRPGGGNE